MGENENNQNVPTNFDEAYQMTANMFNDEVPPEENAAGNEGGEVPAEQMPQEEPPASVPPEQPPVQQTPPQQAQQDGMLQRAFAQNQALMQEIQQLKQVMAQQNDAQKQNIVEEALQMPTLDVAGLAYDDEATVRGKQEKYAQDMAAFIQKSMMKDMSPFIEQAKEGLALKQKNEVLSELSAMPELQGLSDILPQLDNIIAKNRALSSADVPLDEKYITAYLMFNGINSVKNRGKQDEIPPEKFMQAYQSNMALRDLVDKQRLAEIKDGQDVPPMSPSSGAVNAAPQMPKTPTNFREADALLKNYFK